MRKINALRPSAVVLDLRMPRASGAQVLAYMQVWSAMRAIPVVVLTASRLEGRERRALRDMGNCCRALSKPVSAGRIAREARGAMAAGRLYGATPRLRRLSA